MSGLCQDGQQSRAQIGWVVHAEAIVRITHGCPELEHDLTLHWLAG
jgi:hypothetical protein